MMANQSAVQRQLHPTIDTVIDNVEPHAGVIGQAGLTNDPRPVLSGRGEVGSIIHVRVEGNEVGTVKVAPNGKWTYQLPEPLSDGLCRLSVRASNSSGLSMPSEAYMIEVDTTAPPPPTIHQASSGSAPTLSGQAEPYSTVNVYDGKTLLGTATTGADSQWTLSLPSGMAVGHHALTATARDPAGNASELSASFDCTVEGSISENFDSLPAEIYLHFAGQHTSTRYFDVTRLDSPGLNAVILHEGLLTGANVAMPGVPVSERPPTRALAITDRVRLDLHDGRSATRMSFDLGDVTTNEVVKLYFYDKSGNLIYTSPGYTAEGGLHQRIDIDVGKEFTRVEINEEWRSDNMTMNWVDNIVFSGTEVGPSDRPLLSDQPDPQALASHVADAGENGATVFTVGDVAHFSGAGAGAHGGVGNDALQLTSVNQVLDVTALNRGATDTISGIEMIDPTGTGDNTLRMSMGDMLNLGHPDAFRQDGYSQMRVAGNAGDRVELAGIPDLAAGGWDGAGNFVIGGEPYAVYRNDTLKAELFVRDGVEANSGSSIVPVIDPVERNASPGVTDAGGPALKSAEFTFDFDGTIGGTKASTRSIAALLDGMDHNESDGGFHVDHGAGDNTPKLSLADLLNPSHPDLFRADGGAQVAVKLGASDDAQVPGMPELASGSNEWRPVPDGVGCTGAHNAAQDVDLMVHAAMQTTAMA
ncbi:hypothetical protein BGC_00030 [Burkholderia sp. 3C]